MKPEHLVVTDLDGRIVEGKLRPSSDLPPHFRWGMDVAAAAHNAAMLEAVSRMAHFTLTINAHCESVQRALHDKHYLRKHGNATYYGQTGRSR
jgi:ribulose-5-phosphate 4-epimerase/fuculose-1-phosphate aldolase